MAHASKKIKRSRASLTGGFIVGFAVVVLVTLITSELGWPDNVRWGASLILGGAFGIWVRVTDL